MVSIIGAYTTKFGELWERSLEDLILEVASRALKDAGREKREIEAIFIGNMLSGVLHNQEHLGALASSILGLKVPALKIEGACASGSLAVHQAVSSILAGQYETVLVLGVEKMTDYKPEEVAAALMAAASEEERETGLTFPGLYALMARVHMEKYGTTEKEMAAVSVKNHFHASLNGKAHFKKEITVEDVLNSPCIADPLKLLDCSPISDGASAIVIAKVKSKNEKVNQPPRRSSEEEETTTKNSKGIKIVASAVATDNLSLAKREDLTSLKATRMAVEKACQVAGVEPKDIDVAEVHDCFSIAEIIALEDLGFGEKGEIGKRILRGEFKLGSRGPIMNTSGGLKACGHPVGATGVKQIVEIVEQLKGKAGKKQVPGAQVGLTHNVGGTGATAVVHILQRG